MQHQAQKTRDQQVVSRLKLVWDKDVSGEREGAEQLKPKNVKSGAKGEVAIKPITLEGKTKQYWFISSCFEGRIKQSSVPKYPTVAMALEDLRHIQATLSPTRKLVPKVWNLTSSIVVNQKG